MTRPERLFGTDGLRGRYGEGWLTAEAVSALGRAIGVVLARRQTGGKRGALLGHDGRRSGPVLEAALARGLAASGHAVASAGLITTPGLATLGRLEGFDLAVMVSASHNPAEDNGIKVFGASADKLADELEDEIEAELRAHPEPIAGGPPPRHDPALESAYLAHLLGAAEGLKLDGLSIAIDCANGGGSRVAPRVLGRLGAHVVALAAAPDGDNINQGCGSTQPAGLQECVRLNSADLGIALDGDGDRCILVDEHGALVNGDGILTLLARDLAQRGRLPDARIVATVMSNRGLHRALREVGVQVLSVGVGDRRVVEALRREGLALGGEQSGHIVFGAENAYVGDGIYTALRVLRVLQERKVRLSELAQAFRAFPQVLVNVPVERKPNLSDVPSVMDEVRRVEAELGGDGRVLLRYSGTEPLARVMVEGPDEGLIRRQAQELATCIAREIGR
ncbi:MAG TPA: phosphoglucosamine mutase [Planctomycetota bacterium]